MERRKWFVQAWRRALNVVGGRLAVPLQAVLLTWAVAWTGMRAVDPYVPMILGWLPGTLAVALAAVAAYRTSVDRGLSAAGRRFWRQLGFAAALIAPSTGLLAVSMLSPQRNGVGPGAQVAVPLMTGALLIVLWALIRLPARARSRRDWARLGLDASTVLVCAGTFLWHFALQSIVGAETAVGAGGLLWLCLLCMVCLLAVLLVAKLVLAGTDAVDSTALRILAGVVLLGAIAASFNQVLVESRWVGFSNVVTTLEAALIVIAAARQDRAGEARHAGSVVEPRGYSVVPYVAVAAVDSLLVVASFGSSTGSDRVIVAGAVAATVIVVVRQVIAFRDNNALITALREHQELLHHRATHDGLTGLPNRSLFTETLAAAFDAPERSEPVAVLLVDLDGFKVVNDTFGHAGGDAVLVAVADRLRSSMRADDLAARLGGDEFAVVVHASSRSELTVLADRIVTTVTAPVNAHGREMRIGASVGIAVRDALDDVDSLLRNADTAMYRAKREGKGQHLAYEPGVGNLVASGP